jgi:hypothetical protein
MSQNAVPENHQSSLVNHHGSRNAGPVTSIINSSKHHIESTYCSNHPEANESANSKAPKQIST